MRSPDDDSRRNYPANFSAAVHAMAPAVETKTGVMKAPFGRNQHDDMTDRARAAGYLRPAVPTLTK